MLAETDVVPVAAFWTLREISLVAPCCSDRRGDGGGVVVHPPAWSP
ncbi:MAG: hypothetical protein HPM95_01800 [Alphaproteobacteria bacterium]|nr:hypothetical protein [Alphaproteobacteria bacterium]